MKLTTHDNSELKKQFKIVRLDNGQDVDGEIITADEDTGECSVQVGGETKTLNFGPGGTKIVRRERGLL